MDAINLKDIVVEESRFMTLPNELILRIFSSLPFKSLLSARAVCHHWRNILPYANLHPARKSMLTLYTRLVSSPTFAKTRPWVIANLRDFDRKEYLERLCSQLRNSNHSPNPSTTTPPPVNAEDFDLFHPLPPSFAYFVLEWPAKAAICGTWPGLPRFRYPAHLADNVTVREGCSWISVPRISAVLVEDETEGTAYYAPALLVWRGRMGAIWIFLGEGDREQDEDNKAERKDDVNDNGHASSRRRRSLTGVVYESAIGHDVLRLNTELDLPSLAPGFSDVTRPTSDYLFNLYADYISYLYQHWRSIEEEAKRRVEMELPVWNVIDQMPVELGGCLEGLNSLGAISNINGNGTGGATTMTRRRGLVPEMWEAYRSSWVWRDDEAARDRLRMSVERMQSLND